MAPVEETVGSRNILLSRLRPEDQALIRPHCEEISLGRGASVIAAHDRMDAVFFPGSALVSVEEEMRAGQRVEIALVGSEGMLGWSALLGCDRAGHSAIIRVRSGTLLRVPLASLRRACAESASLQAALLQFVHVMIVQMTRAIASGLQHSLGQRLARWLLMCHDRMHGDTLRLHHGEIAGSLGVRRASITDQLHILEGERLLRCTRGQIEVRDRIGLEAYAGEAYGTAEAQYRALIAPFGKSAPAGR